MLSMTTRAGATAMLLPYYMWYFGNIKTSHGVVRGFVVILRDLSLSTFPGTCSRQIRLQLLHLL